MNAVWRKSGRSNAIQANCIEVACGVVAVRDAKNTSGPVPPLLAAGWAAFLRPRG